MAKSKNPSRKNDAGTGIGIKITLIAVAVLCVLALVYAIVSGTGLLARTTTAMTVGGDQISTADLQMYYADARATCLSTYGYYLSLYGYDYTSPTFDAQSCLFDSSKTWKEYFTEQAEDTAEQVSILAQEATKAGMTTSEDRQKELDTFMDTLAETAESNGYSLKKYVKLAFGSGIRVSDVEDYRAKRALASTYYDYLKESFAIGDSEIDAYYSENPDNYDVATYYAYDVAYETFTYDASSTEEGAPTSEADAEARTEAARAAAEETANAIYSALKADGSNFDDVVLANIENSDESYETSLHEDTAISSLTGESGTWLTAEGRKSGDMAVVEDETNGKYTVCLFLDRHVSDVHTMAVRHILFTTETAASDADAEETARVEAANAEARALAEQVYAEWQNGDQTEDSFAALAVEYSEDGSASEGGLITGVYPGQMVTEFDEWCFDESRKSGDHDLIETSYGYHIMYYVGQEGLKYRSDIKATLEDEQFNAWLEETEGNYTTVYSKVGLMLL